jgi:solute carrier family 35, member E1
MTYSRRSPRLLQGVCVLGISTVLLQTLSQSFAVTQQPTRSHSWEVQNRALHTRGFSPLYKQGATPVKVSLHAEESASVSSGKKGGFDFALLAYFAFWYLGNYYYNITNKLALKAAGGATGFPMTIATLQLGVGCLWALLLWGYPDARSFPKITTDDYKKTLLVGATSAGAHAASVFALSAGAVSFGQIVKAAEPAFAALIGTLFYGSKVSTAKWLCLIPVIGGVVLASLGELDFAWAALFTAALANVFAAFKGNENKKLMTTPGLKERLGSVGNQFAITMINSFLFCLLIMLITEGYKFGEFLKLAFASKAVLMNLIYSGLWFYAYNELATKTIEKTNAVTSSVANTAKRVIVIVGVAIVMGESLDPLKLIGCSIGIGGVFLYSVIDDLVKKSKK